MANISAKEFELGTRPYFAFKGFCFKVFKTAGWHDRSPSNGLVFSNPGKVLIQYNEKSLHVPLRRENIPKTQCTLIIPVKYILKPKISFGVELIQDLGIATVPGKGLLEYEFEYFAVPDAKKRQPEENKLYDPIH